jgi:iron complex transport system substrate-binding protein
VANSNTTRPHPRGARGLAAVAAFAVLVACGGGGGGGGEDSGGVASGTATGDGDTAPVEPGAYPVEIEHKHGTTTIEGPPSRVVTVGLTDQDASLALGVVPVGITDWFGDHPDAVHPWAQDLLGDATPEVLPKDEMNIERIAALEPDLILAVYSGLTGSEYETLSAIAPTIAQPEEFIDWGVPWQEQTRIIGQALGRPERADELVDGVEDRFAAARADHPEFEGATGVVATPYDNTVAVYAPEDVRGGFMAELGFVPFDGLDEMAGDSFAAELSLEQVELLEVDALVWILGDDVDADLALLHDEPLYAGLDVVAEGREVGVSHTGPLGGATSFQTVLSVPALLDGLVPLLAAAVDGDPATEVAPG